MRLVSEQSEAKFALRQASGELTIPLRALTANLMRISDCLLAKSPAAA
ncbi:hypothetical protein PKCBPO_01102 [Methylorubrum thiocyanatum]